MSHSLRPHGQVTSALDRVNERIRRLMDEPAGDERTEAYALLLTEWAEVYARVLAEWAEVSRDDVAQAA